MVHAPRKTIWEEQRELADIKIGDWVEVLYEYMPGTCSDGGIGIITRLVATGEDNSLDKLFASVKYVLDNRVEHSINFDRLTIVPRPYKTGEVTLRTRKKAPVPVQFKRVVEKHTPLGWLKWGLTTRKHEKRGWLAEALLQSGELLPGDDALWKRMLSDYRCQTAYLEGMKEVLGAAYVDPREHVHYPDKNAGGKFVSQKKPTQQKVPKNVHSLGYLVYTYGVAKTTFFSQTGR